MKMNLQTHICKVLRFWRTVSASSTPQISTHYSPTSSRLMQRPFVDVGAVVLCCDFKDLPQQIAE